MAAGPRPDRERRNGRRTFSKIAFLRRGQGKDPEFLIALASRLALLLRAGISLTAALEMLIRQEGKAPRKVLLEEILRGLNQGRYLHEVLGDRGSIFDESYRRMIRAGELAGDLPSVLEALATARRRTQHARARTVSALIYPVLVLAVALCAILFLCGHVLPHFQELYRSQRLPTLTAGALTLGQFLQRRGMALAITLALALVALVLYGKTPAGRQFLPKIPFRIPVLGKLLRRQCLVLFLRTFSLSLRHGIPYGEAFSLASSAVPVAFLRSQLHAIGVRSCEGVPLGEILAGETPFPAAAAGLLAAGESAGNLAAMASHAADLLEEELSLSLERLAAILRPLIILLLAALVAWIAIALLLPIAQLSQLQGLI
ncbi:MAG: type II secretion system F family protein [Puniceicoccales bacterium]|jgi:type II secretory pathway component PulF|nr:type II secretion system F family protein [Puniceicoccales bacterium]